MNSVDFLILEFIPELKLLSKINAKFLSNAIEELKKNSIEIIVHRSNSIYLDEFCGGSFDPIDKEIEIAIPEELDEHKICSVVQIFAHEYCHFLQTKSKSLKFNDVICVDDILDPKNLKKDLSKELKNIQAMERDCEKRVLNLIKKGELELNYNEYMQNANYYIAFHDILAITKKWFKKPLPPSDTDKAFKLLPNDKLIKDINCLKNKKYEFIIEFIKSVY